MSIRVKCGKKIYECGSIEQAITLILRQGGEVGEPYTTHDNGD